MNNKRLKNFFLPNYQTYLKEIEFKRLDNNTEGLQQINMNIMDDLDVNFEKEHKVGIVFSRQIIFQPSVLFTLKVSYGAILELYENIKNVDADKIKQKLIYSNQEPLTDIIARASQQISQISMSLGMSPIITQPFFIQDRIEF